LNTALKKKTYIFIKCDLEVFFEKDMFGDCDLEVLFEK